MMKEHRYGLALMFGLPLLGCVLAALFVMFVGTCSGAGAASSPATEVRALVPASGR